ncbi:MAG: hypothetical protein ACTTKL_07430 [Treponema sp.]
MGKQINYYLGYNDFKTIAQTALNNKCIILKQENGKIIHDRNISMITPDVNSYYFYVPEVETLQFEMLHDKHIGGYNEIGNAVIEAGFSIVNHKDKRIPKARLFSISGYYDRNEDWIARPECVNKVYGRLVRAVKKLAVYTEVRTEKYLTVYGKTELTVFNTKEYISNKLLALKNEKGYELIL